MTSAEHGRGNKRADLGFFSSFINKTANSPSSMQQKLACFSSSCSSPLFNPLAIHILTGNPTVPSRMVPDDRPSQTSHQSLVACGTTSKQAVGSSSQVRQTSHILIFLQISYPTLLKVPPFAWFYSPSF